MAHGIVRARIERVPEVRASDDRITSRGRIEAVTLEIFVGTDKSTTFLTSGDRRSTSGREQRQGGDDYESGEDHCERLEGAILQ